MPRPVAGVTDGTGDFSPRNARDALWLGAIFVLALLARVIVLWQLSRNNPGFFDPTVDSRWHYLWAKSIAAGDWLGSGVFYRAPLYPYLLGIWITLFGDGLWPIRLAQAVIGSLSAVLVCLIGARGFGRRVGITAGLIWAIYGTMIYYETELLIEVIVVPFTLLAIWLAMREHGQTPVRLWRWLTVGIVVGLTAIARPNILLALPAFWMWSWTPADRPSRTRRERWSGPLAVTLGALLPIVPVTARNFMVGNDPVLISYQGGVNLYLGNNPKADGLTMSMPEVTLDESVEWNEFVRTTDSIASALAGRSLRPSEVSSFWTRRALAYMTAHPLAATWGILKKTYYLFNGYETGDQTDIYAYTRYSSLLRRLIWHFGIYFPYGLIAPLAVLGIPLAWRVSSRTRPLMVYTVLYALTVIGFLVTARHRLPILPMMVLFAVAIAWTLVEYMRTGKTLKWLVIGGVVAIHLFVFNRPIVERIMANPTFTLYQEALTLDRRGDYAQAVEVYEKALAIDPSHLASLRNLAYDLVRVKEYDSAVAVSFTYMRHRSSDAEVINNMGLAYLGKGDTGKAEGCFRIAVRTNPNLGQPHLNLGDIARAREQIPVAVQHYAAAVAGDSAFAPAYNALALIFTAAKNYTEAIRLLKTATAHAPGSVTSWANLGAVYLENGQPLPAIEVLGKALLLQPLTGAVRVNLAVAYVRADSVEAARAQLQEVLKHEPQNATALRLIAKIDSVLGAAH
ncbi:MAG: tetratricopeptide repeat protein [Candidatus Zixiibacteriota bacterium]